MKKNTKIILVITVAIALAVLAGFMVVKILSPQRETVYIFNNSYSAGTTLSSDMLTSIQVDKDMVSLGLKSNINQRFITASEYASIIRSGDSLKLDVGTGMPLMKSMLSIAGGNAIEMMMKPSAIAVSLGVNGIRGVTNDLEAGSRVNVYYTGGTGTVLLYENMRILSVSKTTAGVLSSVTVEANHEEAQTLINATETGSIYLGLVNASGYQYVNSLIEAEATPEPEIEPEQTPEIQPVEQPEQIATEATPAPDANLDDGPETSLDENNEN